MLARVAALDRKITELQLDGYAQYAASSQDANLYYLTNFLADDPFLFLRSAKQSVLVVSSMEKARAVRSAIADCVRSREDVITDSPKTGEDQATLVTIASVLKEYEIHRLAVNADFPLGLADDLRKGGFEIRPISGLIETLRSVKTARELRLMVEVQRVSERALASVLAILTHSKVVGDTLRCEGRPLTSERLKSVIGCSLIKDGCTSNNVIASSGDDSALPHLTGSGLVTANSAIVFDIFPQSVTSRYHADLSRTVLRGDASSELSEMYAAVQEAQNLAFELLRPGISGAEVHFAVTDYFEQSGFHTDLESGQGFIHSVGHGLGLDVHELPFLSKRGGLLEKGSVVTIEPGLYYSGIGGVRLEDTAVITHNGNRTITRFPKEFVI
ncbi:MAG TPA: Xaa-Pro peptidase family protein [Candidatus Bathyarchaeia archaeon]|nr:Xaa-Pro peptidase family protein [Candidatus Bathyarchaeia archaeon]